MMDREKKPESNPAASIQGTSRRNRYGCAEILGERRMFDQHEVKGSELDNVPL